VEIQLLEQLQKKHELLMNDPETECIEMIGEIGGQLWKPMLQNGSKLMETVSQFVGSIRSYCSSRTQWAWCYC
jgi:succinyl-CoA synthetase alpha subunit